MSREGITAEFIARPNWNIVAGGLLGKNVTRDAREICHGLRGAQKNEGAKKGIDRTREAKRGSGGESSSIAVNSTELTTSSNSIRIATGGGTNKFQPWPGHKWRMETAANGYEVRRTVINPHAEGTMGLTKICRILPDLIHRNRTIIDLLSTRVTLPHWFHPRL